MLNTLTINLQHNYRFTFYPICRCLNKKFNISPHFNFPAHQDTSHCSIFFKQSPLFFDRWSSHFLGIPRSVISIFHISSHLTPSDTPTSSSLTLAYSYPSRLFPLLFRWCPSIAKSPSSFQLFGSTKLSFNAFASQSYLPLSSPVHLLASRIYH